jgi:hypothetical protein
MALRSDEDGCLRLCPVARSPRIVVGSALDVLVRGWMHRVHAVVLPTTTR